MNLNEYQDKAMRTCMPSSNNFSYMLLNLIGEVGEFTEKSLQAPMPEELRQVLKKLVIVADEAGKMAKTIRKTEGHDLQYFNPAYSEEQQIELYKEAGDIAWQLSGLCEVMNWTLENVYWNNILKLQDRQQRNVIDGNGDNR